MMLHFKPLVFLVLCFCCLCSSAQPSYVVVLGTAQDAGYPQAGCKKECCVRAWNTPEKKRFVSCLALVEPQSNRAWIFDATPDFTEQWRLLTKLTNDSITLAGIFLTHAHIGHYTGLMFLGREAMGAKRVPVYAMPRMKKFLETNGPWSQLVSLGNIALHELEGGMKTIVTNEISVTPLPVPHRDEFSETVAYRITCNGSSVFFAPDIDKWEKWNLTLADEVRACSHAFIDATFFSADEVPGRNLKEIPHPLVTESMTILDREAKEVKQRVHFIHLNHSNLLLNEGSAQIRLVKEKGFTTAVQGQQYDFK